MVLYLSGWNRLDVGDWETASARIERAELPVHKNRT